jgi:uncharacterized LabA/DUF88 family protein
MNSIKHKGQRVGVLIDTQNLYHGAKNLYNAKVNFQNIMTDVVAGRDLIRAIAYVINTDSSEEKTFFDALGKMGIETKIKDIQIFSSGSMKADWDIGLAVDAIRLASKLDVIIIVSGDGDFSHLVDYLQGTFGCIVEGVAFGKSASGILKDKVNTFIDLSENPSRYLIFRNPTRSVSRGAPRPQNSRLVYADSIPKKRTTAGVRPKTQASTHQSTNSSKIIRINLNENNERRE